MRAAILLACWASISALAAIPQQTAAPVDAPVAAPAMVLTISGTNGHRVSLTAADLAAMPHQSLQVHNAHTGNEETYQGVLLSAVLTRVGAPLGQALHGPALATYLTAQGQDGYKVVYSLAEVDPAFHSGTVIVADQVQGKPLGEKEGPFKLVNTEDHHPARWVRNLTALTLHTAQ